MLVQVDGWSGSGKSVLMYLLDGHPEIYSHPFHDIIQYLFDDIDWNEEWVKAKDILELRKKLVTKTVYYKAESFIYQKKYVVEYSSKKHLNFDLNYSFAHIDAKVIGAISNLEIWTPINIVACIFEAFRQEFWPNHSNAKYFISMGYHTGRQNFDSFLNIYPGSKRILIKRDIADIIAVRTGRKPIEIDYRSKTHNNINVFDLIKKMEIEDCLKYYQLYEAYSNQFPDSVMIVEFDDLIKNKEGVLRKVCEFLNISFEQSLLRSTFLGMPIEYENIDYSDQILDFPEELLTRDELVLIKKEIDKAQRNIAIQSRRFPISKVMDKALDINIHLSKKMKQWIR